MTVFPAFGRVGFAWIAGAILYGIPNVLVNFERTKCCVSLRKTGDDLQPVPTMARCCCRPRQPAARSQLDQGDRICG